MGVTFFITFSLKRHSNSHNEVKFSCNICPKTFTHKLKFVQYKKIVHGIIIIIINVRVIPVRHVSLAIVPVLNTSFSSQIAKWGDTVGNDAFLEAVADFENQDKKIYYYYY